MKRPILAAVLVGMSALAAMATTQPYAGQDGRAIASLSAQDIDDLLAGRGWGLAKAAELNGYPGPAHVLELADDLALTEAQRSAVEAIFAAMNARARELGAEFVAAEAALDEAFGDGSIDAASLPELTARAAAIEADLRAVHLAAHLEVTPLLSRHQNMMYNRLRGYGAGGHGEHSGHSGHGNN